MIASTDEFDTACDDTLGGRISLGREAAGLTVAQAARRLGVMTESWNAWERDRDVPRASRLTMMAGLLGVSPSWLLTGMGSGPFERPEEQPGDLMRAFQQTSDEIAALNRRMQEIAASLERKGNPA
ncbi:helix-turn-helix transcriptional regulator [Mesorhizobium sp. CAU 1741]|uniref:helix-turn-helix domain-containing protein n=1 Tax=Mesorhizobium sp. CAU 1741 TaxID=3140366 RepID=UPI00325B1DE0